jgi:hypothetical protein
MSFNSGLFLRYDEASEEKDLVNSLKGYEFTLVLLSRFWRRWYCPCFKVNCSDFFNLTQKLKISFLNGPLIF